MEYLYMRFIIQNPDQIWYVIELITGMFTKVMVSEDICWNKYRINEKKMKIWIGVFLNAQSLRLPKTDPSQTPKNSFVSNTLNENFH